MRRTQRPEVVYVERGGDSSARWLFWGALLGAGLALLYAPRSGEETRRLLQRRLWKLRAMTEEKLDELSQQFAGRKTPLAELTDEDDDEVDEEPLSRPHAARAATAQPGARQELERRLADARARRRAAGAADVDVEEPLA
jgi:gas vesicle protein